MRVGPFVREEFWDALVQELLSEEESASVESLPEEAPESGCLRTRDGGPVCAHATAAVARIEGYGRYYSDPCSSFSALSHEREVTKARDWIPPSKELSEWMASVHEKAAASAKIEAQRAEAQRAERREQSQQWEREHARRASAESCVRLVCAEQISQLHEARAFLGVLGLPSDMRGRLKDLCRELDAEINAAWADAYLAEETNVSP